MRTLNASEGKARFDTKSVGSAHFPTISTVHVVLKAHLMCPLIFCPYI